jgi:tetraacyldisaccharide 4'-kinase
MDARAWLLAQWFGPGSGVAHLLLRPLAALYRVLERWTRRRRQAQAAARAQPACPVVVIGNLVVGGAGKTPTTIAIVQALQAAGRRPGVVSRGYGRQDRLPRSVGADSSAAQVGDEPLLIHRRTGVPVMVERDRVQAAQRLLAQHPQVDVIVADDGLQHRQLRRDVEVVVFDERGVGNGQLLPAGPLREPMQAAPGPNALVLYNHARATTAWPGFIAQRRLTGAWPLAEWLAGQPARNLDTLRGRPLLALAGIAVPERFFAGLRQQGLAIVPCPQADHQAYDSAPWPAGTTEVVTTEKDAVKLQRWASGDVSVWVVGLDLELPADFVAALLQRLPSAPPP